MSKETDPNGFSPREPGAKMDNGKVAILRGALQYFPLALTAVAEVSMVGAKKYSWKGWEKVSDGVNRYGDALVRHLLAENAEEFDRDTNCRHAAQVAWNALARLELILREAQKSLPVTGGDSTQYFSPELIDVAKQMTKWYYQEHPVQELPVSLPDATGDSTETEASRTERWLRAKPDSPQRQQMLQEQDKTIASGTRTGLCSSIENVQSRISVPSLRYTK